MGPSLLHHSSCLLPPPSDHLKTFHPNQLHPLPPFSLHSNTRQISTSQTLARKEGMMVRFKQMVKDYWYVIIPVEISTSLIWYGSIYITQTLGKLPSAEGNYGYHALAFLCYKVISPIRHGLSLAISAALVTRLNKTRPGYLRTSSSIAKEAKETGEEIREKYDEKVAEGKGKMDELKSKAEEKTTEVKKDMKDKMDGWRKK